MLMMEKAYAHVGRRGIWDISVSLSQFCCKHNCSKKSHKNTDDLSIKLNIYIRLGPWKNQTRFRILKLEVSLNISTNFLVFGTGLAQNFLGEYLQGIFCLFLVHGRAE